MQHWSYFSHLFSVFQRVREYSFGIVDDFKKSCKTVGKKEKLKL